MDEPLPEWQTVRLEGARPLLILAGRAVRPVYAGPGRVLVELVTIATPNQPSHYLIRVVVRGADGQCWVHDYAAADTRNVAAIRWRQRDRRRVVITVAAAQLVMRRPITGPPLLP